MDGHEFNRVLKAKRGRRLWTNTALKRRVFETDSNYEKPLTKRLIPTFNAAAVLPYEGESPDEEYSRSRTYHEFEIYFKRDGTGKFSFYSVGGKKTTLDDRTEETFWKIDPEIAKMFAVNQIDPWGLVMSVRKNSQNYRKEVSLSRLPPNLGNEKHINNLLYGTTPVKGEMESTGGEQVFKRPKGSSYTTLSLKEI